MQDNSHLSYLRCQESHMKAGKELVAACLVAFIFFAGLFFQFSAGSVRAQSILPAASAIHGEVFNIRAFGAKGDGKALDSPAINTAIDAATAKGGGTVYLPSGSYRCFTIRLKSN